MRLLLTAAASVALLLPGAATAQAPGRGTPAELEAPCEPWLRGVPLKVSGRTRRVEETVCFAGAIDPDSARSFLAVLAEIPAHRPIIVVMRSGGGDVLAGLDMGEALLPRPVTAVASSLCASSCANYVFMAADRRVIAPESILVFHGGMTPGHLRKMDRELAEARARRRRDAEQLSGLERGRIANLEGAPRQGALLRAVGADPEFFAFFDGINARPRRTWSPDCAAQPRTAMLVFSDAFLRARGVAVENHGPKDAPALRGLLGRRRAKGLACWWE